MPELKKIKGLLSDGAGQVLQEHARQVASGRTVVEIGSYTGKSTCYLATALPDGVAMYAIDTWDTLEEDGWWEDERHGYSDPTTFQQFKQNLKDFGVSSKVRVIRGDSAQAVKRYRGGSIGLLWVDGDHRAKGVRRDLHAWVPKLDDDTVVLFDDYYYGGVSSSLRDVDHEVIYKKRVARSTGKALREVYG